MTRVCLPRSIDVVFQLSGVLTPTNPEHTAATGSGVGASTLGPFTFTLAEEYTLSTDISGSYVGQSTYTFEDESTLEERYSGFFNGDAFVQTARIVSGAGRFASASGKTVQAGNSTGVDDITFVSTEEGRIR